jgi:hypothetical protein
MLDALKRIFRRDADAPSWPAVERWALACGCEYRRARDGGGFVVEGRYEGRAWRLEWGPSQRQYISGQELRLRMDLPLPAHMHLLLLSRELMNSLESATFDRYTDNLKTQIDSSTPEEMRWLVMYPKLSLRSLPALRDRIGAVGSSLPSLARWIDGPLGNHLSEATLVLLSAQRPFVLMTSRNRVVLRIELPTPAVDSLEQAVALFEVAVSQTPAAIEGLNESTTQWPSTATGSWQSQLHDEGGKGA